MKFLTSIGTQYKKIQFEDSATEFRNDFHPLQRQKWNYEKFLCLQNVGDSYTLKNIGNDFAILSIQTAADCFRISRTMCLHSSLPSTSNDGSKPTHSRNFSLDSEHGISEGLDLLQKEIDQPMGEQVPKEE